MKLLGQFPDLCNHLLNFFHSGAVFLRCRRYMFNVEEGIEDTFSDIVALEACCKFGNCRHETEPGCAVKRAIANGELSEERLALYQSLGSENQRNYAKKKQISKWIRQQNKFYSKRS